MISVEPISVDEFRQLMAADLDACCEAFDLRAEYCVCSNSGYAPGACWPLV